MLEFVTADLVVTALASSVTSAFGVWLFWIRPMRASHAALEERVLKVLPAAQEQLDDALDEKIAALDAADDEPSRAISGGALAVRVPAGTKIPPPDLGLELKQISVAAAIALAKQAIVIQRESESLAPTTAALKWPPGTVFKDGYDSIFITTRDIPLCVYQKGRQVEIWADRPLSEFKGGKVELLVTPAELRANHLIA